MDPTGGVKFLGIFTPYGWVKVNGKPTEGDGGVFVDGKIQNGGIFSESSASKWSRRSKPESFFQNIPQIFRIVK
jgi:hypothetical protein